MLPLIRISFPPKTKTISFVCNKINHLGIYSAQMARTSFSGESINRLQFSVSQKKSKAGIGFQRLTSRPRGSSSEVINYALLFLPRPAGRKWLRFIVCATSETRDGELLIFSLILIRCFLSAIGCLLDSRGLKSSIISSYPC